MDNRTTIKLYPTVQEGDELFVQIGNEKCYIKYKKGKWYRIKNKRLTQAQNKEG